MTKLQIVMFPWFASGHVTPFIHLANEFATKGHRVTILVPKKIQLQHQHLSLHPPNLIAFSTINVPHVEGLPDGAQSASDIHISLNHLLATAMDLTRNQVETFLRSSKPHLVFYDFAHWIPEITSQMGVKSVYLSVVSAASLAIALVPARNLPVNRPLMVEDVRDPPPGYPSSTVVLSGNEASSLLFLSSPFGDGITFFERSIAAMKNCDALCIRTCTELEGPLCDYMGSQFQKQILLTGPLLPTNAASTTCLEDRWARWLGRFEPGSTVFCAFGSQIMLDKDQFQELVLGFELTGLPFLVALKAPLGCETVEEALPEGFEERVKGRGVVYGGWVQQPLILSHPSVGCFVNHCGFGSMWESLMSDNQIVLVPHLGDQILNTKLLTGELKVAVEVERESENRWFSKESLSKAVNSVMEKDSKVGIMVRSSHAKWRELLSEPGFISGYIDGFIKNLEDIS